MDFDKVQEHAREPLLLPEPQLSVCDSWSHRSTHICRSFLTRVAASLFAVFIALSTVGTSARQSLVSNLLQPVLGLLTPVLGLLTNDLLHQLTTSPEFPARIIVCGDVGALFDVAARHRLPVLRVLDEFVVTRANAAQWLRLRTSRR
jgi:hypothetical protein